MKKLCLLLFVLMLLTGCGKNKDYETRLSSCAEVAVPSPGIIDICVPDELSAPVMSTQGGDRIYIADDYEVSVQTMTGGDLSATLKNCTGYDMDRLTVMQTQENGMKRYDCAWTSAGEGTQDIGRITVLDDGYYHYVLSVTADADGADAFLSAWQQLSDSMQVSTAQ